MAAAVAMAAKTGEPVSRVYIRLYQRRRNKSAKPPVVKAAQVC